MADGHHRSTSSPALQMQPLTAEFAILSPANESLLYSILPSAVQSRLPRIPSLRHSVSIYGFPTRRKSAGSISTSTPGSGSRTPEVDYKNAMVLMDAEILEEGDVAGYFANASVSSEDLREGNKRGQGVGLSEEQSGIGWKFANQGFSLLTLAVEESSSISKDSQFGNASFARQLYLHAVTYLLRGLPADLTTEEQLSVRSALPAGIAEPLRLEINGSFDSTTLTVLHGETQPSLLHRTLASTIVQLFVLCQFVLPYLKYLLSTAYGYDREHKISEKVVARAIETVDIMGKKSLTMGNVVLGMGDGRIGQLVTEGAAWLIEGVTGGIHEGIGEGMMMIGVRRQNGLSVER